MNSLESPGVNSAQVMPGVCVRDLYVHPRKRAESICFCCVLLLDGIDQVECWADGDGRPLHYGPRHPDFRAASDAEQQSFERGMLRLRCHVDALPGRRMDGVLVPWTVDSAVIAFVTKVYALQLLMQTLSKSVVIVSEGLATVYRVPYTHDISVLLRRRYPDGIILNETEPLEALSLFSNARMAG